MVNKKVGFWVRFSARVCDLIIILSIVVVSGYFMIEKKDIFKFKESWMFYLWMLETISLLFIWFILIPVLSNGQTLFMWLFRIKIIFGKNKLKQLLKREMFFSINWIICLIATTLLINHTLIDKYVQTDQSKMSYNAWEKIRISLLSSLASISILMQFIFIVSIIVRGNKGGLHDSYSKTKTVWVNKYIKEQQFKNNNIRIKPRPIKNNPVIWLDEE